MVAYITISADLPKNADGLYEALAGSEYLLSGITTPNAKLLLIDNQKVEINQHTHKWELKVIAPNTGVNTIISHTAQVFGSGDSPHDLFSNANKVDILILPACD